MGLFDFFRKRKPEPPPEDEGPSPDYAFAHYALRSIALSDPLRFLVIVTSPDAEGFLAAVLEDVAKNCGRRASFTASSIKIHPKRVNSYPCCVVELPEPKEFAEAYMVAIVVLVDTSSEPPPDMSSVEARYFTLEKGFSMSNEPRTVLAEWDAQAHSNYGDGPAATVDEFVASLKKLL